MLKECGKAKPTKMYTYTECMNFTIQNDEGWNRESINELKKLFEDTDYFKRFYMIFKKSAENEINIQLMTKKQVKK